jgi:REP element-mobilizing transposase RayT
MARPLRLEFPGAIWHVTARGNARGAIFVNDGDRTAFLGILEKVVDTFRWQVHAWVLMGNHYHLVVETPDPNLARGMRQLNGIYTQRFNARHERVGHLLQGRYKALLVERQTHLLELARYVVLNPVRGGLVEHAADWPWSSYRATAGLTQPPAWLEVSWLLTHFDGQGSRRAQKRYAAFVAEGIGSGYRPWSQVIGQLYLGREQFVAEAVGRSSAAATCPEHPRAQRAAGHAGARELLAAVADEFGAAPEALRTVRRGLARKALALLGRQDLALHLRELAPMLGVTDWSVSHLATAGERLAVADASFRAKLEVVRRRLSLPDRSPYGQTSPQL